jgi:hypothetical protein
LASCGAARQPEFSASSKGSAGEDGKICNIRI